ncbi:unnamed protein product [Arabidopsis halleri]
MSKKKIGRRIENRIGSRLSSMRSQIVFVILGDIFVQSPTKTQKINSLSN